MTQSRHILRTRELPTHSGGDLLPHKMVASKLSEGLNDSKTQLGQWSSFYFQIFQLEEEKKQRQHFRLGYSTHLSGLICMSELYWESLCILFPATLRISLECQDII